MLTALLLTLAYFAGGLCLAIAGDQHEMSKPVPFGEMPHIASLEQTRRVIFLWVVLVGVAYFAWHFPRVLIDSLRREYANWRFRRAFRRAAGRGGVS